MRPSPSFKTISALPHKRTSCSAGATSEKCQTRTPPVVRQSIKRGMDCRPVIFSLSGVRMVRATSLSGGNRRVLFDELALLQLPPELRRDLDLHGAVVSDNLLLAGGADHQGRGEIRRCGELQRRRPEIDAVPSRYVAQLFALFDDRLRDLVVLLAVVVTLTAADEAGVERRTPHECNALGARR